MLKARYWAVMFVVLAAGCGRQDTDAVMEVPAAAPVETPEQFAARREAEVQRVVAAARAEREAAEAAARATASKEKEAAFRAKLLAALKDPESAKLGHVAMADHGAALCGYVNARNGFGGYTGDKQFVVDADGVFIASGDVEFIVLALWSSHDCDSALADSVVAP